MRTYEIEALMDEEIQTITASKLKPYHAIMVVAEALPALGIVAAVLGVIKAMGAIDQSPKILSSFIGAALVGTFAGIFLSYGMLSPLAIKIKMTRENGTIRYKPEPVPAVTEPIKAVTDRLKNRIGKMTGKAEK